MRAPAEPLPTEFRSVELRANGLRFAAFEGGSGDLALLLHGFPDDARSLLPLATRFVASGFPVSFLPPRLSPHRHGGQLG
jgi:hypothetical protein